MGKATVSNLMRLDTSSHRVVMDQRTAQKYWVYESCILLSHRVLSICNPRPAQTGALQDSRMSSYKIARLSSNTKMLMPHNLFLTA
jgi:hypothetical protein